MSIKHVSIFMIVFSAIIGLLQIFICKAYSCGFYTISNAFVWWVVYSLNNTTTTQRRIINEAFKLIDILFNELRDKKLTKEHDNNNETDGREVPC